MSARELARALGGEASGRRVHCPGPGHSRQDRSLSILLDPRAPDGFIVHSFAGDDPLACRDHVRELLGLGSSCGRQRDPSYRTPGQAADDGPTEAQRIVWALAIWRTAVPIPRTLAERYLASRGVRPDNDLAHVLRFHSRLRYGESSQGMVALVRDALTGEPCGVHRTFIDGTGKKLGRRMLGRASCAAIMIDAPEDVGTCLHIGEGIESVLAARQLGYRPAWAMGSSGAIGALPLLAGIEALTVLGENDAASIRAARAVCERYEVGGVETWLCLPRTGDLNDTVKEAV